LFIQQRNIDDKHLVRVADALGNFVDHHGLNAFTHICSPYPLIACKPKPNTSTEPLTHAAIVIPGLIVADNVTLRR
jgi:hypothetical protein